MNQLSIRITRTTVQPEPSRPPLWRVLHWIESDHSLPGSRPEMWPFFPNHYSNFDKGWQLLSRAMNPKITDKQWTALYGYYLWIANNQGFGMAGSPRANYVTGENLTYAMPKVELLTCGGNVVTGHVEGSDLVVDVLDWHNTPPSVDWIMARPWYYTVPVQYYEGGAIGKFPQGKQPDGSVVTLYHPLIGDPTRYPRITIPLNCLEKWDREYIPDPFTIYNA